MWYIFWIPILVYLNNNYINITIIKYGGIMKNKYLLKWDNSDWTREIFQGEDCGVKGSNR